MARDSASTEREIAAIDLFCGAGGLSAGLKRAGIRVVAGFDTDATCRYPFETNIGAKFFEQDVRKLAGADLQLLWPATSVTLLAGCAPCQPFSPYRRGVDTSEEEQWPLLNEFGRLVEEARPDLVTMENVARMGSASVFTSFVQRLTNLGYSHDWRSCYGPDFGLPQHRRRLVLVASSFGSVVVPTGHVGPAERVSVRDAISSLPPLASGESDERDPLHKARALSPLNLKRIQASSPGGTWEDWPVPLRAACHRRATGATFRNVYARMEWDAPAPTITTLAHNFGAGRFGHPEQDRPISLREAAVLQGFSADYAFAPSDGDVSFSHFGRLIGNAVPPPMAQAIGMAFHDHVRAVGTPEQLR